MKILHINITQSAAHRAGSASRVVAVEPSGCALPLWDSAQGCIQTRRVWRRGPAQQLGVAVVFQQFDLLPVSPFPRTHTGTGSKVETSFRFETTSDVSRSFRTKTKFDIRLVFLTIPKSNCFGARFAIFARAGSQFGFSLALVFAPKQFQLRNSSF